jgi:DNA-binding NtrC family response regulator
LLFGWKEACLKSALSAANAKCFQLPATQFCAAVNANGWTPKKLPIMPNQFVPLDSTESNYSAWPISDFSEISDKPMASPSPLPIRSEERSPINVFVISPNSRVQQEFQERLIQPHWKVISGHGGAQAMEHLRRHAFEEGVVLLDPQLPDIQADEFIGIVISRFPQLQVLTLNAHTGQLLIGSSSPTAISIRLSEIINRSGVAISSSPVSTGEGEESHRNREKEGPGFRNIVGNSEPMRRVYSLARMVAERDTTVLIAGESGTGKDLIAEGIHQISRRRKQPFVVVNCAAIPETLLESELFGYTKGALTGAVQSRMGRIHAAQGGTLFLDEIGDMPLTLQSKILRFLEQGEVQRLGGTENFKVDVRVVAATNADLMKRIAEQQFREDLYYRLAVFPLRLPPLRDRMDDIKILARFFASRFRPGSVLSAEALHILMQHRWPGNVRELRNVIERASILMGNELEIAPGHIVL